MREVINTKINSIKKLTEGLFDFADSFSFVLRDENLMSQQTHTLLNELSIYLIIETDVKEWPGTKLTLDNARLFKYYLNKETAFILSFYNDNLYNWLQPTLPEDIVFYKNDQPVFVSITHEKEAYFEVSQDDINLIEMKGFKIIEK